MYNERIVKRIQPVPIRINGTLDAITVIGAELSLDKYQETILNKYYIDNKLWYLR